MALDRIEHVAEPAHHMRADRLELHRARQPDQFELVGRDGEMVRPEMDEPLGEGGGRGDRAQRTGGDHAHIDLLLLAPCLAPRQHRGVLALIKRGLHAGLHRRRGGLHVLHRPAPCHRRLCARGLRRPGRRLRRQLPVARALGLADLPLAFVEIGEIARHLGARHLCRDHLRARIEARDLPGEPFAGIGPGVLARPGTETEAIERDTGVRHATPLSVMCPGYAQSVAEVCHSCGSTSPFVPSSRAYPATGASLLCDCRICRIATCFDARTEQTGCRSGS